MVGGRGGVPAGERPETDPKTTPENATLDYVVPADPTNWSTARAWTSAVSGWTAGPVLVARSGLCFI
ncbi:hypothetical protein [Cryobacterium cheniae]|uniref:hypothetical protein n=1 Tax=Cryobacterium cheniae TaxID=1259262 RepID=UPI00141A6956|nr:hypothetical protein [Cryobacterium cheniae]